MVILHQPVSSGAGIRRGESINGIKRTKATSNDLTSAQFVAFIIKVSISYFGLPGFWENYHENENREGYNDSPFRVRDDFGGGNFV
jgi:hypothetical protein